VGLPVLPGLFPDYFPFVFGMIQIPFPAPILGTYRFGLAADFLDLHILGGDALRGLSPVLADGSGIQGGGR